MNLNQLTLAVTDFERAVAFYKKLDLTLIVLSPEKGYARFECPSNEPTGGTTLSLHRAETVSADAASLYFEVDDVDARVKDLKAQGIAFDSEPVDQTWLWREAWMRDPDGHRIAIYHAGENRRFPPWRIAD